MSCKNDHPAPVLILGAGINGCGVARELALNGVPVWIVDTNDISFGATSRSSRLIHGGLRYLEYGEFRLVRESLAERQILLDLAPHFVRPLRLFVPVSRRSGGVWFSMLKYLSGTRIPVLNRLSSFLHPKGTRGLWLVRLGLWLYDFFAHDLDHVGSSVQSVGDQNVPCVNQTAYRWLCAYSDAQMRFPERFTLSMLEDARSLASKHQVELRVFTHSTARPDGNGWQVTTNDGESFAVSPSAVVNATGAWGDLTLNEVDIEASRLLGGTRGSHLLTSNSKLRDALGDAGVYAETDDGRLVFILPFNDDVLVGTTDVRFSGRPEQAIATDDELEYLIDLVNDVMPDSPIGRDDVSMHYSGVRPLPFHPGGKTAAISRDHSVYHHRDCAVPTYTLVGGKLTTCRAFAELVADRLFATTGFQRLSSSAKLSFAGGDNYPGGDGALNTHQARIAQAHQLSQEQVRTIWELLGTRTDDLLRLANGQNLQEVDGTHLPLAFVYWAIDHEWAQTLDDLVDRRLMLLYRDQVTEDCLRQMADCLVDRGLLDRSLVGAAVNSTIQRLTEFHGKTIRRST
ncbi:MAG: glycerol-3-phosphate dehydrogenase/oxidase [Fuerstiella sp.]|nr:glycerol-3-phosphate dehydrogenase/oxidase [Fuerstiella sp.]MCP4857086.1 glycerol-3-phosphate dehydrogenase/oxidase [Fuerstiella sp.]